MVRSLQGRTALVTGASRRLGRAIALRLARAGAVVGLHHRRDAAGAAEAAACIRRDGGRAETFPADLSVVEQARGLIAAAEDVLGPLDLLVDNAATFHHTPLESMTIEDYDRHAAPNARAVYVLSLEAGRRMKARGHGAIVNVLDVAAMRPWAGYIPYSASKGAALNLTRGFARALAPEVRVNAVAPGPILPPAGVPAEQAEEAVQRTLLRRWGKPEDVAEAVLFLATSPYLTGVVLPVDGGRAIGM